VDWFVRHVHFRRNPVGAIPPGFIGRAQNDSHPPSVIGNEWNHGAHATDRLGFFSYYFVKYLGASDRIGMVQQTTWRSTFTDPPNHPLHYLEDDNTLLARVRDLCVRLFRVSLSLDSLSTEVRLRVGVPDVPPPPVDEQLSNPVVAPRGAVFRVEVRGLHRCPVAAG
jgi:hypothetical protein